MNQSDADLRKRFCKHFRSRLGRLRLQMFRFIDERADPVGAGACPASVANPVDLIASASAAQFEGAIDAVLADSEVDSVLAIFIPPLVTGAADVAQAIHAAAARSTKPVLAS